MSVPAFSNGLAFRALNLRAGQICPPPDEASRKKLLGRSLRLLEVEVFSFCNRRCAFCPNAKIDRHSQNIFMPETTFLRLIEQLREINFSGTLSFSRYNEPLADRVILTRIAQAKKALPSARLHSNSNGDYINAAYVADLERAGLTSLHLQAYLSGEGKWTREAALERLAALAARVGLKFKTGGKRGSSGRLMWKAKIGGLSVAVSARDFETTGSNRGGLLDLNPVARRSPCHIPFTDMYIDYNGAVMPCCNLRSDAPEHAGLIMGDINETPLTDIYFSKKAVAFRNSLLYFSDSFPPPCDSCFFLSSRETPATRQALSALMTTPLAASPLAFLAFMRPWLLGWAGRLFKRPSR